mgnify:CR=1 FL=1
MSKFPNQDFQIPVCIADLPAYDFQVDPETLTETVVTALENHPELPGVLIVRNQRLLGFMTRLKLFERLAHRYGVELFLRKPISELNEIAGTQAAPFPGHLRVDEAVQRALQRPATEIYDPVIVEYKPNFFRILDINVLVLAQSRIVTNLSNVVGKLQQLDNLIHQDWEKDDILLRMLRLLGQVVPYHQGLVLLEQGRQMRLAASLGGEGCHQVDYNSLRANSIYKMLVKHRQPLYLPDTSRVPAWQELGVLGAPVCWLGIPLLHDEHPLGLLSLGRNIKSPYTVDERDTATAFAQRMVKVLIRQEKKKIQEPEFQTPGERISVYAESFVLAEGM